MLSMLSWADNGPVIHVYVPRKFKGDLNDASKNCNPENRSLEVLYPYDCRPAGVSSRDDDHPDWLKAGHAILKIVAEHLERLNSENISQGDGEKRAFAEMLPEAAHYPGAPNTHTFSITGEHLPETLDRLARLRRRMADYSAHYNRHLNRLKRTLFCLAFGSALFFSLADNWDSRAAALPVPQMFFIIALGSTLAAWIIFFYFKRSGAAERCDDYRAIAEGLRVQFYWTACGSGESVASNYLQRQRGELGWIRNVISVAAFPYEQTRVDFNKLTMKTKRALLDSVRTNWITGQCDYFKKRVDDLSARRELFSAYAQILLWTGCVLFTFFFFFAQNSARGHQSHRFALLTLCTGSLALVFLFCMSAAHTRRDPKVESQANKEKHWWLAHLLSAFYRGLIAFPPMFLPKQIQSCQGGRFILKSVLVVSLSLVVIGTVYLLEGAVPWLPTAYKLGSVFKYLALVVGVLCGAWVEVNFFAEHIRHYASMASLFEAAGMRFQDCFDGIGQNSEAPKGTPEMQVIADVRSLIVAVGREALSENAEWLITHRARPLEPVSA
ncbi:MAG: hypothetical protein JOY96_04895 [Verrucomicrobia bacterium]|nr:hypothetical protein [Verrucomicrobiota bacterium]